MREGREAFNRGEFFEAHEFWEEVWNVVDDPDRRWIQGMIQIATGLHKLAGQKPDVAITLLQKALAKLHDCPRTLDGFALGAMRTQAHAVLDALRAGKPASAHSVQLALAD
jgi:predicted metal-dependent hydrolase